MIVTIQIWSLWIASAVLVVTGSSLLVRAKAPMTRRQWVGAAALFVAALAARLVISPHTLMHENARGYEFLYSAFRLEGYFLHGSGYYAFFYLVTSVFGKRPEVVFTTNAILGSASSVLVVYLGRRISGNEAAGWLSGIFFALWPLALRISASESMFPLALFMALVCWAAFFRAWDSGRPLWFFLSASAASFAVQTRPMMMLWPAVLLFSLPVCRGWTGRLRSVWPWLGLVLFSATTVGWVMFQVSILEHEGLPDYLSLSPGKIAAALGSRNNLFIRSDWTSPFALVLAGVGLAMLLVRCKRAFVPVTFGFAAMSWLGFGATSGDWSSVRLLYPLVPFFVVSAAYGAASILELTPYRIQPAVFLLFTALLSAVSLQRTSLVRQAYNAQKEYAFLERTVRRLPSNCAVITADRFMGNRVISTEFPVWWLGRRKVKELKDFVSDPDSLSSYPCRLFYRGLACYRFTHLETESIPKDGVRPECRLLEKRYDLTPYSVTRFANRRNFLLAVPARQITVGFYRLREPDRGGSRSPTRPIR